MWCVPSRCTSHLFLNNDRVILQDLVTEYVQGMDLIDYTNMNGPIREYLGLVHSGRVAHGYLAVHRARKVAKGICEAVAVGGIVNQTETLANNSIAPSQAQDDAP